MLAPGRLFGGIRPAISQVPGEQPQRFEASTRTAPTKSMYFVCTCRNLTVPCRAVWVARTRSRSVEPCRAAFSFSIPSQTFRYLGRFTVLRVTSEYEFFGYQSGIACRVFARGLCNRTLRTIESVRDARHKQLPTCSLASSNRLWAIVWERLAPGIQRRE